MIVDETCIVEECDKDMMVSSEKQNVDIDETNKLSNINHMVMKHAKQ